jgi:hypothetical protein
VDCEGLDVVAAGLEEEFPEDPEEHDENAKHGLMVNREYADVKTNRRRKP